MEETCSSINRLDSRRTKNFHCPAVTSETVRRDNRDVYWLVPGEKVRRPVSERSRRSFAVFMEKLTTRTVGDD